MSYPFESEKEMEDYFCKYLKQDKAYKFIGRQINTHSGRLDVLCFDQLYPNSDSPPYLNLYELKNRKLKIQDISQLLLYKHELNTAIVSNFDANEVVNSVVYEYFSWFIRSHLIGTDYSKRVKKTVGAIKREGINVLTAGKTDDKIELRHQNIPMTTGRDIDDGSFKDIAKVAKEHLGEYYGGIKSIIEYNLEEIEKYGGVSNE